jgi:hypothetical protein
MSWLTYPGPRNASGTVVSGCATDEYEILPPAAVPDETASTRTAGIGFSAAGCEQPAIAQAHANTT